MEKTANPTASAAAAAAAGGGGGDGGGNAPDRSTAGTSKPSKRKVRSGKLLHLQSLLGDSENSPSVDLVLDAVSDYAAFEDSKNGAEFKKEDLSEEQLLEYEGEELRQAKLAGFIFALSDAKLQIAHVPDHPGEKLQWDDCGPELERQFLPDTTEFQLTAAPWLLWTRDLAERPQSLLSIDEAWRSLDTELEDQGDVLWRLDVPTRGFPVGESTEGGTCILREHHRHVMYVALTWLLRNSISAALNSGNWPTPATVAAICGSAGIGKSRSLVFLMWFLLRQRAAFLLECGSDEYRRFVLARPRQSTITVYTDFDDYC